MTSLVFPPLLGSSRLSLATLPDKTAANIRIGEELKRRPDNERRKLIKDLTGAVEFDRSVQGLTEPRLVLSWEEVSEMLSHGITFGSHTHTHPILTRLPVEAAKSEISTSKRVIEEKLSTGVHHFAFPNGRLEDFSDELREYCTRVGFRSIASAIYGVNGVSDGDVRNIKRVGAVAPIWRFAGNLFLEILGGETALGLASYPEIDVVLDYRREEVDGIAPHVRRAIVADVRQTEILEQEGAKSWSAAVIGIRRHFDSTVLFTHFLKKKIGIRTVIVQVNNLQEEEAIRVLGADLTVFPERDSARHLVATFIHPLLTEIVDLGEDIELMEIEVPKPFVGKNLRSLQLRAQHQLHVVALRGRQCWPTAPAGRAGWSRQWGQRLGRRPGPAPGRRR